VTLIRPAMLLSALVLAAAAPGYAAQDSDAVPLPRSSPLAKDKAAATKSSKDKTSEKDKTSDHDASAHDAKARDVKARDAKTHDAKTQDSKIHDSKIHDSKTHDSKPHDAKAHDSKGAATPLALAPNGLRGSTTGSAGAAVRINVAPPGLPGPAVPAPALRPMAPTLAMATSASTSPLDLNAVKQTIDLVHKGRTDEATALESSITDPLARKLTEWLILRSDDSTADFARYSAFIAANPSWPSIITLRRRAEATLWQEQPPPATVIAFFRAEPPHSAKGKFALARALLGQGNAGGAQSLVQDAWRNDAFSNDIEAQARDAFATLLAPEDDKARMDVRLYAEDDDAGLRAARHLDAVQFAIAKARAAVINKESNAKALLEAVPAAGQRDAGYLYSRVQWLFRADKVDEAGRWLLAAPRDPAVLHDVDQWWVQRRLVARKLLDLGDYKMAYQVANEAATPSNDNFRAEQQFTAGWIALRFLHDPAAALAHFAKIADGVSNPITLARSYYWQARAAEAAGREQEARGFYETAARYPTAYYGQLARARLGLDEVSLRELPQPAADLHGLEVARAFEILYAADARDIVATMAADLADKTNDAGALTTLADIARRHDDARTTLLIGKAALGRGFPFEQYAFPDFGVPTFQQIGPTVERSVVFSIVRQESAFNPKVVSGANALGLMQVTPAAGRDTAKRFNVTFDQRRLINDVAYNAQLGTAELGADITFYRGSYILAFVSYNAGRGRAAQWIEQYGDPRDPKVDPVDWIERIPISETRNYVQRVLENMQVYRARLDNNAKLSIETDLRRGS
jgi:soluble lytic murein transglycosylase